MLKHSIRHLTVFENENKDFRSSENLARAAIKCPHIEVD